MFPLRDSIPSRTVPFVTFALILVNLAVFLMEWNMPVDVLEQYIHHHGVVPTQLTRSAILDSPGALSTLLTYMFLHGSWLHLILNMWALWLFGDNVEDRLGHFRFLFFYLACGVIAVITHILVESSSALPTVGASGAIAGVMGAYFLMFPYSRMVVLVPVIFYPLFFEIPSAIYLLLWIFSQIFSGAAVILSGGSSMGGVAFSAHVGGFIAGMFFARRHSFSRAQTIFYGG